MLKLRAWLRKETLLTMPVPKALPPARRLPLPVTLAYGFGAAAYGVKDFGFSTFLLLFYNQVLGLPAAQVGLAIGAALIIDAFIDPAVGFLSDRTDSRWGRRHPWMLAAALPIALGWLALWNPPELSRGAMLAWAFITAVIVRTAVSAYEVPSQALTPELSADYDERTRITAYRYLFGWAGGLGMLILTYAVFLVPGPEGGSGVLNRAGYVGFSIASTAAMLTAILVSTLGTANEILSLPRPVIERRPLSGYFLELVETVRNPAFATLMAAGLCFYTAHGISFALSNYLYIHVWRMEGGAFNWLGAALFGGAVLAFTIAPVMGRRMGKPRAAMLFMTASSMLLSLPYALRFAGLFPATGDPTMLPLLLFIFLLNAACAVSATILGASMMADVVEHSEAETGRRSEGVFFAGAFFVQKCTSGLGILLVGSLLSLVGFPDGAAPGSVAPAVIDRLTLTFIIGYLALGLTAAWLYSRFPFGKAEHEARLARMRAEDAA